MAIMSGRSQRAEVRNPIIALPGVGELFRELPVDSREALIHALDQVAKDARERAETCWRKHKAPMAAYWKAVSVYAGHLRRALKHGGV